MTDIFENIDNCCVKLRIDLCGSELAKIASDHNYTAETMEAMLNLFTYLSTKRDAAMVQDILNKSRLSKSSPKTFDNWGVRTKSWTKTHGHREKCILKNNTIEHWKFMKKPNLLRKQFRGWAILRDDRLYIIGINGSVNLFL